MNRPRQNRAQLVPRRRIGRARGFTLVELMITVAIAAILLTLGVPSYQSIVANNRLATASNDLLMGLTAAKTEAIRQNASIRFCLDPEALTWRVMTTASIDLRVGTLPANLTAAHANLDTTAVDDHACVRFRPNGLSYGTGNALMTNGSITLTTQGKNRAVNVRTGAFDVAGS